MSSLPLLSGRLKVARIKRSNHLLIRLASSSRVVVTGMGVVSPVGCDLKTAWTTIINGGCGIVKLGPEYDQLPCRVAGVVNREILNIDKQIDKTLRRSMSEATQFAVVATKEALADAKWVPTEKLKKERTGVSIGTSMMDIANICETYETFKGNPKKISPFFIPRILNNMTAGRISMLYGFRGPNVSSSTACATGVHAIGDAFRLIKYGHADVMVCGGTEACINPFTIASFSRMKALSTKYNNTPEESSRPFDKDNDGFVMGEGAAILILEDLEHAVSREAPIYAEILGYGASGDASHLTAPSVDGSGIRLAMERAAYEADIDILNVSYVNAHATSTPLGDDVELGAIRNLFGDRTWELFISSTKGATGHLLGAAGSLETVFTVQAIYTGILPPTLNYKSKPSALFLNAIPNPNTPYYSVKKIALKNSVGFGGTNACLCLRKFVPSNQD